MKSAWSSRDAAVARKNVAEVELARGRIEGMQVGLGYERVGEVVIIYHPGELTVDGGCPAEGGPVPAVGGVGGGPAGHVAGAGQGEASTEHC